MKILSPRPFPGISFKKSYHLTALLLGALLLANTLLLTACVEAPAARMHLKQTEGTVCVADSNGRTRNVRENLALHDGSHVSTESESYAWLELDNGMLAKLGPDCEIGIQKEDTIPVIEVVSGGLFFDFTGSTASDEEMEIASSSMQMSIQDACGWVYVPDAQHMELYLLKGKAQCTAGENTVSVKAGEKAAMTVDGGIEIFSFTAWDIPMFAAGEIGDYDLSKSILEDSGLDITACPMVHYWGLVSHIDEEILYMGNIDFESDGSPELMVIYTQERDQQTIVSCMIYQCLLQEYWHGGYEIVLFSGDGRYRDGCISLVEFDHRLCLKLHIESGNEISVDERDFYYGFGFKEEDHHIGCTLVEALEHGKRFYQEKREGIIEQEGIIEYYTRYTQNDAGIDISAEEYRAFSGKYRDTQILVYTPNNANIIAAPSTVAE